MTLFKTLSNRDGFAFIVVIAVLFLVTILAMAAFNTSDTDRQISSNNLSSTRVYYAAEAGAIRAMAVLTDSANWRAGSSSAITAIT
jgi:Tfp pilus assembly protein PilX